MNGNTGSIRRRRLCGILLALPLLLGACSGEENADEFLPENIPISFSGNLPQTKAAKEYTQAADLDRIGVFAYFTHGDFSAATATPNFMYNQLVAKQTGGTWTYTPIKFWPNESSADRVSFFAYAPYVSEAGGNNPSFQDKGTASGFPVLGYTVPTAENNQIDLLAATPVMNRNNGNISFKLHHTLTKVNIYVKSNDDTEGKSVTSFSMTGMKSGTLTYHAPENADDKGWQWSDLSAGGAETFTANATGFAVPDAIAAEKKLLATFYLLPYGEGSKCSITYQYTATDSKGAIVTQTVNIKDRALPSTDDWTAGAVVGYTIGISRKTVTVVPENIFIPSWEEGSAAETVNGTEEK